MGGKFEDDLIDVSGSIIWKYHDVKTGLSLCETFLNIYAYKTGRTVKILERSYRLLYKTSRI